MSFNNKNLSSRTYQAPDCDACPMFASAIICESLTGGSTEDWVYDENDF